MPKSDWLKNAFLNHLYNGAALTLPATIYIALYTSAPTTAGGGTEVAGGAYARVAITRNTTNFPTTSNGTMANAVVANYAQATAAWGSIVAAASFDALTGGNMIKFGVMLTPRTIGVGDQFSFAPGAILDTET